MTENITKKYPEELGITVYARDDEPFENMMKRFDQKILKSRILIECKERRVFKKPSKIRREKLHKAKAKERKRLADAL